MPGFDIKEYTVLCSQTSAPSVVNSYRALTLTSVALFHNIRNRATLYFFEPPPENLGLVTNVDQPNLNGHQIYAFLRKSDYAEVYDVLRSEKPVRLTYFYSPSEFNAQQSTRTLLSVQVGTGDEPPGEGPEDVSPVELP
jgi:hypothetical protein